MADPGTVLQQGREAHAGRAWSDAHDLLSRADAAEPLQAEDLERLAVAAYMLGRDDEHVRGLERAYRAHLDNGDLRAAARCAFWAGMCLALRGRPARATGWFGRARRLVDGAGDDWVERGYLLLPVLKEQESRRDFEGVRRTAADAARIAERHGDRDLLAMALHEQGRALVRLGRVADGLALLDETMVAVTAGELSPIVTGLMYCSVIDGCREAHALRRAAEWTEALSQWCAEQPDVVSFTGRCLIHRAEIMQLHGAWSDALAEARRAHDRFAAGPDRVAAGEALYRQGELHRLRGELPAAEAAYRAASERGRDPQPGLALLRAAQGRARRAAATIRRVAGETAGPVERAALLPACIEILLAAGDDDAAREACDELAAVAATFASDVLDAVVAQARGAVAVAGGEPGAALADLRRALAAWQEVDVPYEAARVRVLIAQACRALGDEDTAVLELEAARAAFAALGAGPDAARTRALAARGADHGLTARELEILRMVAGGRTNKAIAAELVLSERTVDRHVSNILAKVGAPSRAAATAFAYEHELV